MSACYPKCRRYQRLLPAITLLSGLGLVVVVNAALGAIGVDTNSIMETVGILRDGAMKLLLENGLGLDGLELGLEILEASAVGAAVGAATSVG